MFWRKEQVHRSFAAALFLFNSRKVDNGLDLLEIVFQSLRIIFIGLETLPIGVRQRQDGSAATGLLESRGSRGMRLDVDVISIFGHGKGPRFPVAGNAPLQSQPLRMDPTVEHARISEMALD